MKTINQINAAVQNSPTIQHYLSMCTDKFRYSDNWRVKSWHYFQDGHTRTPLGQFIFGAADRELQRITGTNRLRKYEHYTLPCGRTITVIIESGMHGVSCQIQWYRLPKYLDIKIDPETLHRIKIRSNETFESFDVEAYMKNYIESFMHPEGTILRQIQLLWGKTKSEAIQEFKVIKYSRPISDRPDRQQMIRQGYIKLLKKRCNIVMDQIDYFATSEILKAWETYKGTFSKFQRKLQRFNPWELHDQLSSEFDDEDDLIRVASEIIYEEKIAWI